MRTLIVNPSETLLDILKPLFNELYFTTIKNGFFRLFSMKGSRELLCLRLPYDRPASFLLGHIAYVISFLKTAKKVDIIILSQTADYPLLTMFIGKIMDKKIIDFVGGSRIFLSQTVLHSRTTFLRKMASIYGILSLKIASRIAEKIVLISEVLISNDPFSKFKNKIRIAWNFPSGKFYDEFRVKKRYHERDVIVGYVGKFTLAKGVYNFALAIKAFLKNIRELKIMFVGDWQNSEPPYLGLKIKHMFENSDNVIFTGPVPHQKVADYLNEMKLLILPSYSEGLPHVILEAMACGTPVLVTPVGAIPHVVRDGENGFLLKFNDSKHITKRIVELLDKPELLEKVSINAYRYVGENFSYEKTLEAWQKIFGELGLL